MATPPVTLSDDELRAPVVASVPPETLIVEIVAAESVAEPATLSWPAVRLARLESRTPLLLTSTKPVTEKEPLAEKFKVVLPPFKPPICRLLTATDDGGPEITVATAGSMTTSDSAVGAPPRAMVTTRWPAPLPSSNAVT